MTFILPLILLVGCALCVARPRAGLIVLLAFAMLVSNAKQAGFLARFGATKTLSVVPLSGFWVVDSLGVRILIASLLCGALFECLRRRRPIRATWVLKSIAAIVTLGIVSSALNRSDSHLAASALYFMVISLMFLAAASNLAMEANEVKRVLNWLLGFVCLNAAVQVYQFLFTAAGDVDSTVGLLMSTTPTSTLAFAVAIPALADWTIRGRSVKGGLCVGVALIQLVSSYLKGIFGFAAVVVLGVVGLARVRVARRLSALVLGGALVVTGAFLFGALALDADDVKDLNFDAVTQSGPVRVWSDFLPSQPAWWNVVLGYGPGAYGSVNTFDDTGDLTGRLGGQIRSGPAGRDVFRLALSSAGNILWENGVVALVLFLWVHYRIYRTSSTVATEAADPETKALALGIMGGVLFTLSLYMVAFAETLEQPFLWAPAFLAFSVVEREAERIRFGQVHTAGITASRILGRERPRFGRRRTVVVSPSGISAVSR